MLFAAVVTGSFVLVAILMIISTVAKDVKQATTISPLLLFVILIPTLFNMTDSFSERIEKLGSTNYLIPVWNSVKMLQDVIRLEYTVQNACTMIAVNIAAAAVGIFIVGRLFNREKIVNG
jgi:ABC-type Na+ efflux pump permease subunit